MSVKLLMQGIGVISGVDYEELQRTYDDPSFALVHGAWHGAWCWDRLVPEIEAAGHAAVAMDLPAEDWSAGCLGTARVVAAALDGVDGDVVVVGHSLGGVIIPVVAALRRVRRLVFLCALIPRLGMTMDQVFDQEKDLFVPGYGTGQVTYGDGSTSWDPRAAIYAFFHDCEPTVARWAASMLRRQVWATTQEPCLLTSWPSVPASSILCWDDRCISAQWARRAARDWLGAEAIELPGGHSPMLSRPAALARALVSLA